MTDPAIHSRLIFPRWCNGLPPVVGALLLVGAVYVPIVVGTALSPRTTAVGYQPDQPVEYRHTAHAGRLGLDCRYCHATVERAAFAALPPTRVCMNCHATIRPDSPMTRPLRESEASGRPIEWIKVHALPDSVFFHHGAHVTRGIGCAACHGRVAEMEKVHQVRTLSMAWCLDCHRSPDRYRFPAETTTPVAGVSPGEPPRLDARPVEGPGVHRPLDLTSCSICHR